MVGLTPTGSDRSGSPGGITGAPGVPGAGGKTPTAGPAGVSVPRGSVVSRLSRPRSVAGGLGGGAMGAGPVPPMTGGGAGSAVPWTGTIGSLADREFATAAAVPATGAVASPICPARSVSDTRTVTLVPAGTRKLVEPSSSGRVWTGVQVVPLAEYSSRNLDQSGFFSVTFQTTVTSSPMRWALAIWTTGFLVSNRTLRAGAALNTSAGSRRPALSTTTMLNQ